MMIGLALYMAEQEKLSLPFFHQQRYMGSNRLVITVTAGQYNKRMLPHKRHERFPVFFFIVSRCIHFRINYPFLLFSHLHISHIPTFYIIYPTTSITFVGSSFALRIA